MRHGPWIRPLDARRVSLRPDCLTERGLDVLFGELIIMGPFRSRATARDEWAQTLVETMWAEVRRSR